MIFDYVTEYCLNKESIPAVKDFDFEDFDGFLAFLKKRNYTYESEGEKILMKLKKEAESENYMNALSADFTQIENKIKKEKENDLMEYKDEIVNIIEKQIASRYYYQKGKIQVSLKNDEEIVEAVKVLNDNTLYTKLLKNK